MEFSYDEGVKKTYFFFRSLIGFATFIWDCKFSKSNRPPLDLRAQTFVFLQPIYIFIIFAGQTRWCVICCVKWVYYYYYNCKLFSRYIFESSGISRSKQQILHCKWTQKIKRNNKLVADSIYIIVFQDIENVYSQSKPQNYTFLYCHFLWFSLKWLTFALIFNFTLFRCDLK